MNNLEAAWSLNEIADLLEIKGENPYKIRAYKRAAASITNLQLNLEDLYKEDLSVMFPGLGRPLPKSWKK